MKNLYIIVYLVFLQTALNAQAFDSAFVRPINGDYRYHRPTKTLLLPDEIHGLKVLDISKDSTKALLYSDSKNGDIFEAEKPAGGEWGIPYPLAFNKRSVESTACYGADDRSVYFSSNRKHKKALGGQDIYFAERSEGNLFEKALHVTEVNSVFDDKPLFFLQKQSVLFLASKQNPTFGYDIYSANTQLEKGSPAHNLGKAINTTKDELCFRVDKNGEYGILISKPNNNKAEVYEVFYRPKTQRAVVVGVAIDLMENLLAEAIKRESLTCGPGLGVSYNKNQLKPYKIDVKHFEWAANRLKGFFERCPDRRMIIHSELSCAELESSGKALADKRAEYMISYMVKLGVKRENFIVEPSSWNKAAKYCKQAKETKEKITESANYGNLYFLLKLEFNGWYYD